MYTLYLKDLDGSLASYNVIVHGIGNNYETSILIEHNIIGTFLVNIN